MKFLIYMILERKKRFVDAEEAKDLIKRNLAILDCWALEPDGDVRSLTRKEERRFYE